MKFDIDHRKVAGPILSKISGKSQGLIVDLNKNDDDIIKVDVDSYQKEYDEICKEGDVAKNNRVIEKKRNLSDMVGRIKYYIADDFDRFKKKIDNNPILKGEIGKDFDVLVTESNNFVKKLEDGLAQPHDVILTLEIGIGELKKESDELSDRWRKIREKISNTPEPPPSKTTSPVTKINTIHLSHNDCSFFCYVLLDNKYIGFNYNHGKDVSKLMLTHDKNDAIKFHVTTEAGDLRYFDTVSEFPRNKKSGGSENYKFRLLTKNDSFYLRSIRNGKTGSDDTLSKKIQSLSNTKYKLCGDPNQYDIIFDLDNLNDAPALEKIFSNKIEYTGDDEKNVWDLYHNTVGIRYRFGGYDKDKFAALFKKI